VSYPFFPLLALALLNVAPAVGAAGSDGSGEDVAPAPFRRGAWQVSLAAGYGDGLDFGADESGDVELAAVAPQVGVGLTDVVGGGALHRGQLALLAEGTYLDAFEPRDGHAAGAALLLRYHWLGLSERFVPFVQAGAGMVELDFDLADQEDGFNFTLQAGVGVLYRVGRRAAVTAEWRLHHISNAGLDAPNDGINTGQVLIGASFFFD
jgi:opacity protein-like surface antigen